MTSSFSSDAVKRAADHLFLPPKLPQEEDLESEIVIPAITLQALQKLQCNPSHGLPQDVVVAAVRLLENIRAIHGKPASIVDEATLLQKLESLAPREMLAVNVTAQNAAVLMSRFSDATVFECFELSPTNEAVMGARGRLERTFPDKALRVDDEQLRDQDFTSMVASTITKMSCQSVQHMQPKSKKSGSTHEEHRDTTNPSVVTSLFFGALSSMGRRAPITGIKKHTRDDVLWCDSKTPWRRSPMWLLIRVALQCLITRMSTRKTYKLLITYILSHVLDIALRQSLAMEILYVMEVKIDRRLLKIGADVNCALIDDILSTLGKSHVHLTTTWRQIQHSEAETTRLDLDALNTRVDFHRDMAVELPQLSAYLGSLSARQGSTQAATFSPSSGLVLTTPNYLPSFGAASSPQPEVIANLQSIETWVREDLSQWANAHHFKDDIKVLATFGQRYQRLAAVHYRDTPEALSTMVLTMFNIWITIDQIAGKMSSLLWEFKPDLPVHYLASLLLKTREQMQQLLDIESYLQKRETTAARPATKLFDTSSLQSIAALFYDQSHAHQSLRAEIERKAEQDRNAKIRELEQKKLLYLKLSKQMDELWCVFKTRQIIDWRGRSVTETIHDDQSCRRCQLEEQQKQLSIRIHEWPLPADPALAKVVVFELRVPDWFSYWRDSRTYLVLDVLMTKWLDEEVSDRSRYSLDSNDPHLTSTYYQAPGSRRTSMVSNDKPAIVTHYKEKKIEPWMSAEDVCFPYGCRHRYVDTVENRYMTSLTFNDKMQQACTYRLSKPSQALQHFLMRPAAATQYVYPSMAMSAQQHHHDASPESVETFGPAHNVIIAQQHACPDNMTLEEFKDLATVPNGMRLQWYNILLQLACPTVDFKKHDTLLIFLQCIYQTGVPDGQLRRPAHAALGDADFVIPFLVRVSEALQRVRYNWESINAVVLFAALTVRVLCLSDGTAHASCLSLLDDIRKLTKSWVSMLEDKTDNIDDDARLAFTRRGVQIALVCISTYDLHGDDLVQTLNSASNVSTLVQMAVIVHEGLQSGALNQPLAKLLYLRSIRILHRSLSAVARNAQGLNDAMSRIWPAFNPSDFGWHSCEGTSDQWLYTRTAASVQGQQSQGVHINVLDGTLLVNGLPLDQAPASYRAQPLFSILFGRSVVKVLPGSLPCFDFTVKREVAGFKIHLGFCDTDGLVVRACKGDETFEVLPSRLLEGHYPRRFVEGVVHWLNVDSHNVTLHSQTDPWNTLQTATWLLGRQRVSVPYWIMSKGEYSLLGLQTETSRLLCSHLSSLVEASDVHIMSLCSSELATIELPGLQLEFSLAQGSKEIMSRDHVSMYIDSSQALGSLVGLRNKLVLKSDVGDRVVLIPEAIGAIVLHDRTSNHVTAQVPRGQISRIHTYAIDTQLKRLVDTGSLSSKLYLAYLQALTSSCLPDPLGGATGTESALSILRSAVVFSYEQLSNTEATMLTHLAALTCHRAFYPQHEKSMQEVSWNKRLGMLAQHCHFLPSVEAILNHYQDTKALFQDKLNIHPTHASTQSAHATQLKQGHDQHLHQRARLRVATFSISGFGKEDHTAAHDVVYTSREMIVKSNNAAALVYALLSNASAIPSSVPTTWSLREMFQDVSAQGPGVGVKLNVLAYDSAFATAPSAREFVLAHLMPLHRLLRQPQCASTSKYTVAMWISTLSFASPLQPDQTLLHLLALFVCSQRVQSVPPPAIASFQPSEGNTTNTKALQQIFDKHKRSFRDCPQSQLPVRDRESQEQWNDRCDQQWQSASLPYEQKLVAEVQKQWPTRTPVAPSDVANPAAVYVNVDAAMREVTHIFQDWHDNLLAFRWFEEIENVLRQHTISPRPRIDLSFKTSASSLDAEAHIREEDLFRCAPPVLNNLDRPALTLKLSAVHLADTLSVDLSNLIASLTNGTSSEHELKYAQELQSSAAALAAATVPSADISLVIREHLERYHAECQKHIESVLEHINNSFIFLAKSSKLVQQTPRITTRLLLKQLSRHHWLNLSPAWQECIKEAALSLTALQRAKRLLKLKDGNDHRFKAELDNAGHTNWNPLDYPEVLLMEVENNILVREVQMHVADQMIAPNGGQNATMVLNMGQGKSTVLVPVILINVANDGALARVIVGKPQSKQMAQMLRSKLGGLIDRRIYYMPFTRKLQFDQVQVQSILRMLKACQRNKGVLLLQPEHILSFQLMIYERYIDEKVDVGRCLAETQDYFDRHARDVVDECDENFSVKFELIYSIGRQNLVDGGADRWRLWQEVLGLVRLIAPQVFVALPESVDILPAASSGQFSRIRILRPDGASLLVALLAEKIRATGLHGIPISRQPSTLQVAILCYLKKAELTQKEIDAVEQSAFWTESTGRRLMLLRGLLAGGLLAFVLGSKRWRVQFGRAGLRSPATRLAVPYLAKDCPTPRSEFSHPDVVIWLTSLDFYYSGLRDDDLFAALALLLRSDEADAEYALWKRDAHRLPAEFSQLQGINLEDRYRCITKLFPSFRFSKAAVDFFLDKFVFAKEMKEFPSKLTASGWDIGKRKARLVTGFSGTNDSYPTLPLAMHHLSLPESCHTNAIVLQYLLQPENNTVLLQHRAQSSTDDTDARLLLRQMTAWDPPVQVVLDVGAQVVEMTNREFSQHWLSAQTQCKEAVIYINEYDELCVIDREGRSELLQTSRFASRLSACLVFLDEAHTRGIDLQLPVDYRAVVTLGANLTKDRLVQACMRLRQLGKGQSVVFCVQEEIRRKIVDLTGATEISVGDVLRWSIAETHAEVRRSMPLWAAQGERFIRQTQLLQACQVDQKMQLTSQHARSFLEDEALSIETRYRPQVDRENPYHHLQYNPDPQMQEICKRLRDFDSLDFKSTSLQEEQERELAPEVEQERQREVPPPVNPAEHSLHRLVRKFASSGVMPADSEHRAFRQAFASLEGIGAASDFPVASLATAQLLVTRDFERTVVLDQGSTSDSYQRSVQWVLTNYANDTDEVNYAVIISPYEANQLLDRMKHSKVTALHLYKPRCNSGYASLDDLAFFTITARTTRAKLRIELSVQLALFAGELYLPALENYIELCRWLGLARDSSHAAVAVDGFILRDQAGRVGGESGLVQSPVHFLQVFLSNVRRNGDGISKTHMGKLLGGEVLQDRDFELGMQKGDTGLRSSIESLAFR